MAARDVVVLCLSRAAIFDCKLSCKADSDDFCLANAIYYVGRIHNYRKRGNGGVNDLANSRCDDFIRWGNFELYLNLDYELPCQFCSV